ncbi:non-homologous end-joining DNA ligase [Halocola ammonii]
MKVDTSNLDKVFFPRAELTKGDLIDFYESISDFILPHLKDRPLTLQRFPDGIQAEGFYQKEAGDYFPEWIETKQIKKEGGTVNQVICNNKSTLKYLVNQGTISFHTWLSKKESLHKPDMFIIDLDPPQDDFEIVRESAFALHEFFKKANTEVFLMTTGSQGLHLVLPLQPESDFDHVREVGKKLGEKMTNEHADLFTTEQRKDKRNGKLYFDIQRNAYAQTSVTPYSVRPIEGAPVATPLSWDELKKSELNSQSYTVSNLKRRLSQKEDPWKGMNRHRIKIESLAEWLD